MAISTALVNRVKSKWMRHARHFWWGDRLDSRFLAAEAVGRLRGQRILDIGCNAGIVLSETGASNVKVGLELAEEPLGLARTLNPGAVFVQGDMFWLPFGDASFDVVIFCGMLEVPACAHKAHALAEAARVLRPGGELILTTLNRRYARYRHLESRVTYEELEALLAPWFDATIRGFNPLPPFPYGLPNGWLARVPGIWTLLTALMERNVATRHACSFFVTAIRRPLEFQSSTVPLAGAGVQPAMEVSDG